MKLAAVLIVKNEAPYLFEWVAHHRAIGFDEFLIHDNESTDETPAILAALAKTPGVDVIKWSVREGVSPQASAYSNALVRLRGRADYAAFIDADEFLIPTAGSTIKEIIQGLEQFPDFAGLSVNQVPFGPNGQEHFSPEPVLKRFPCRVKDAGDGSLWTKTIYRVARQPVFTFPFRHSARWKAMTRLARYNASGQRLTFSQHPDRADTADFSGLQLNHYIVKSREEYDWRRLRGGGWGSTKAKRLSRHAAPIFDAMANTDKVLDEPTLTFAAAIEQRVEDIRRGI